MIVAISELWSVMLARQHQPLPPHSHPHPRVSWQQSPGGTAGVVLRQGLAE